MSGFPSSDELPLLDLFTRLQEAGLPLGIDEYRLLLRSLQHGFGTTSFDSLEELCRLLWVKSSDDEHLFNYHFKQVITASRLPNLPSQLRNPSSSDLDNDDDLQEDTSTPSQSFNSNPASTDLMELEDEMQIPQALQITSFNQTDEYFPVTRRQMKQSWRYLRRLVREGLAVELDIEATIDRAVQQWGILEPVLVPRRTNRTELLLLIDQKGSMTPFHALAQRLADTAQRGGRLGKAGIGYFHNCPTRYLYQDWSWQQAEPLANVLNQLRSDRSVVLIFSDAGAARGGLSLERLKLTETFLNRLKRYVRHAAWLNPMPKTRWVDTTAEEIAQLIPMFELSRRGMDRAIDVLKGRSVKV